MFKPRIVVQTRDMRIAKAIEKLIEETALEPGVAITLKRSKENTHMMIQEFQLQWI